MFLDIPDKEKVRARLAGLMKTHALGVPVEHAGYYFFASCGEWKKIPRFQSTGGLSARLVLRIHAGS